METSTTICKKYIRIFELENGSQRGDGLVTDFLCRYKDDIRQELNDIPVDCANNDQPKDIKASIAAQYIEDELRQLFGDKYPGFSD